MPDRTQRPAPYRPSDIRGFGSSSSDQRLRGNDAHKADGDLFRSFINIKNKEPEKRINERIGDAKQDVLNITGASYSFTRGFI